MLWLPAFLPFAKLYEWQVQRSLNSYLTGRGRNTSCPVPPAQIPASATNALGSSLEYERQSGNKGVDVVIELWERNAK